MGRGSVTCCGGGELVVGRLSRKQISSFNLCLGGISTLV